MITTILATNQKQEIESLCLKHKQEKERLTMRHKQEKELYDRYWYSGGGLTDENFKDLESGLLFPSDTKMMSAQYPKTVKTEIGVGYECDPESLSEPILVQGSRFHANFGSTKEKCEKRESLSSSQKSSFEDFMSFVLARNHMSETYADEYDDFNTEWMI